MSGTVSCAVGYQLPAAVSVSSRGSGNARGVGVASRGRPHLPAAQPQTGGSLSSGESGQYSEVRHSCREVGSASAGVEEAAPRQ